MILLMHPAQNLYPEKNPNSWEYWFYQIVESLFKRCSFHFIQAVSTPTGNISWRHTSLFSLIRVSFYMDQSSFTLVPYYAHKSAKDEPCNNEINIFNIVTYWARCRSIKIWTENKLPNGVFSNVSVSKFGKQKSQLEVKHVFVVSRQ